MPAGEVELAHRRHVCSVLIPLSRESLTDRLDLEKIFGRKGPLHVDLGCGDGAFLCALAERVPEKNFLGIERLLGRIRTATRKAANIANVRLLRVEGSYAVQYLLPSGSVETFYLLFPDPWPKRRHHRHRIVTPDFLNSVHAVLDENGLLLIATDHVDYFDKIKKTARLRRDFRVFERVEVDLPVTKFQEKFQAQGSRVYWLELRKVLPVR